MRVPVSYTHLDVYKRQFLHYNRYVEPGTYKLNSDMDFRALITNMHDWETDARCV